MPSVTTPSQTVGPYFSIGLDWLNTDNLAPAGLSGERVIIQGRVLDGDGKPVNDALIEIWQADAESRYEHARAQPLDAGFKGFGRAPTDSDGKFRFTTIKPGRVPGPDASLQAPHLCVTLFMRGLLKHVVTRIYFPDESSNAGDPILNLVPVERRATLIARHATAGEDVLEWNVILQGENETVFFDC